MQNKSNIFIGVATVCVILIVVGIIYKTSSSGGNTNENAYREFAECIADSGAEFYGSTWCPACNRQKDLFGEASSSLPYIECSMPDSRVQTIPCKKAGIEAYPTWRFSDGTEMVNSLSFRDLSEKTGCPLPETQID